MSELNAVVAVYDTHTGAEEAVKELQRAGIDMRTLSIVGKDSHTDEHVVGYYNTGDRMKYWGKTGAFWGGFWGLLFGSAFFAIPGIGPVLVAGPVVAWIVGALEGAVVVGGLSAIGAGLYGMGIPKDSVIQVRNGAQDGQVPADGAWHGPGSRKSQGHHRNHAAGQRDAALAEAIGGELARARGKTMLTNAANLKGFAIRATDGELGTVDQFYFDDETWAIRYLTVDTGGWLGGRQVLISPFSVVHTDWQAKRLDVALTKKQVENSPDIDTHQPVSRQHEAAYLGYYGYPYYWGGPYLWGPAFYPAGLAVPAIASPEAMADRIRERVDGFASAQYRSRHWLSHRGGRRRNRPCGRVCRGR